MEKFKYLIVGGGMTAAAAVEGIRSVDKAGTIGVLGMEADPPYNRPPLTKGLWEGDSMDSIWREIGKQGAVVHLKLKVKGIETREKCVVDGEGKRHGWEKLLLATGGTPRTLPFGKERIVYYRTVADYRRLRTLTEKGKRFAVIGAGFIGSEIAAALALNKKEVALLFPGKSIGGSMFPQELAEFVTGYYRDRGVEVLAEERASGLEEKGEGLVLRTESGREITVDGVVAGIGIKPNVALAEAALLKVEDGIVVDEQLRTSEPDIYAAGDVAAFYNPALGKRLRVEHEDNANSMGKMAGRNMAGKEERYEYLPFFYSDLFDLGYEAVGETDATLETFADWKEVNREGVIYYLRAGRVRGVLLWNVFGKVDAARALIAEKGPFGQENLKGRIRGDS